METLINDNVIYHCDKCGYLINQRVSVAFITEKNRPDGTIEILDGEAVAEFCESCWKDLAIDARILHAMQPEQLKTTQQLGQLDKFKTEFDQFMQSNSLVPFLVHSTEEED
jgi:hypothetical protein